MTDFLLELRSEEIPARMQAKAAIDLERLFKGELSMWGVPLGGGGIETKVYHTPRRLALIATGLPERTEAVSEEIKGPRISAPDQAVEGFIRKTGLRRDELIERDGVWFGVVNEPGRQMVDVLAEAIPAIIRAFPWPKSMRWGDVSRSTESIKWVRPLQGIVALLGDDVVPCEIAGIESGRETMGHRFHSAGAVSIESAATYADQLRDAHVIVDQDERAQIIESGATMAARKAGLELVKDDGLLIENAGLTEWPVPLLGRFDAAFLAVPPEVIQLTARVNQKYFVCADAEGKLANAFVCTANIDAADGGAGIIEGNRKVLAARLSDAKFFYDTDLKVKLEEQTKKLDRIVFHEKLGTVADKVERVAKLAEWLAREGIVPDCDPALAKRAADLCKADLVTGMVGEFPELQGVMGGYYAAAQGEDPRVAAAIRDHYKPVGQSDDVPTEPVTVAVSLADKLDTIVGFFLIDERPTGSKDPFALRRAMLGIIRLIIENQMRVGISWPFQKSMVLQIQNIAWQQVIPFEEDFWALQSRRFADKLRPEFAKDAISAKNQKQKELLEEGIRTAANLDQFLADRLKVQQREAGVRHDLIDAVFALGGEDDLVRLLARVHALQAFIGTADGANLLAGYKRAANILKKEGYEAPNPSDRHPGLVPGSRLSLADEEAGPRLGGRGDDAIGEAGSLTLLHPAEAALIMALDLAEPTASAAVAREDFESAMAALASLRAPIDAFFEGVIVNDPDHATRAARLALLARVRDAVHTVADFSRIEG